MSSTSLTLHKMMRTWLATLALAFTLARPAVAQIARDTGSVTGSATTSATSLTYAATIAVGTNRLLFVSVATGGTNAPSVTFAGVSTTQVGSASVSGYAAFLFCLVAPTQTTGNVVVTLGSGSNVIASSVESFTGAQQSCTPDASNTNTSTSTGTLTVSLTTVAANTWTIGAWSNSAVCCTTGTGATVRDSRNDSGLVIYGAITDSNGALSAGSNPGTVTGGAGFMGGVLASFAPAGGAAPTPCRRMLLGVGCDELASDPEVLWSRPGEHAGNHRDQDRRQPIRGMVAQEGRHTAEPIGPPVGLSSR